MLYCTEKHGIKDALSFAKSKTSCYEVAYYFVQAASCNLEKLHCTISQESNSVKAHYVSQAELYSVCCGDPVKQYRRSTTAAVVNEF